MRAHALVTMHLAGNGRAASMVLTRLGKRERKRRRWEGGKRGEKGRQRRTGR